jgi:NADH:quinone reductase (non-electrogenic)
VRQGGDLHRIIVVGGGAGGLELVTQPGDNLGRRNLAKVTLIDGGSGKDSNPLPARYAH